ncbi:TMEM165/GDT1 family protein [Amycolatopsis thermophila]|uniref:GDT1 family protein n=1 Tax=Amycolatopsis thermophila TaxID=206084 RepID=A0ABU0ERX3_9PSEU|nr:TMEM165/GDT1 family protein [Amycolatopsis thermophila]MDQ0378041.1 putative Ca2+/H+ antiporter (TMEM165/GDT1 family) [Amycolatopsis thermophila]
MSTALLALLSAYVLVLAVELPDKTMIATLVLTTRFRAWPVLAGVSLAFAVQSTIAVLFGRALTLLPESLIAAVVAALFGIGAVLLLREGFSAADESGEDAARQGVKPVTFVRAAATSFGVLFAAEWGDASQLATAGLTARYGHPLMVGVGSLLALITVASVAVFVGHKVRGRLKPKLLQRIAGFAFAVFAVLAVWQAFA